MSFKDILKVFKLERELTDDETALLNTLRGMSESERELLAETLGPAVKAKAKPTATKRVIEHCAFGNCGLTRRAAVHKISTTDGYHEFLAQSNVPAQPTKSRHASSLAGAIKKKTGDKEPRCIACYEIATHSNHDLDNGGHEFTTDLAKRVNAVLDGATKPDPDDEERCTATREGGRTCNLLLDHNVHQMKTAMGYHEFVGGETAVGVGGD